MSNYIPEDVESCGNAALIAWINPDYEPDKPTGLQLAAAQQTRDTP